MPDEVSHILATYLFLKHPKLKDNKDFQSRRGVAAAYFFTILPDFANLILIIVAVWIMASNGLPLVFGPDAAKYPEVQEFFMGSVKNIYYIFHSYVTLSVLLIFSYLLLKRIYLPMLLGMGFSITLDVLTHKDATALKPFYPVIDAKVNGLIHWGSFEFYTIEVVLVIIYTIWLIKKRVY